MSKGKLNFAARVYADMRATRRASVQMFYCLLRTGFRLGPCSLQRRMDLCVDAALSQHRPDSLEALEGGGPKPQAHADHQDLEEHLARDVGLRAHACGGVLGHDHPDWNGALLGEQ